MKPKEDVPKNAKQPFYLIFKVLQRNLRKRGMLVSTGINLYNPQDMRKFELQKSTSLLHLNFFFDILNKRGVAKRAIRRNSECSLNTTYLNNSIQIGGLHGKLFPYTHYYHFYYNRKCIHTT